MLFFQFMEFKPYHIKSGSQALSNAILNKFFSHGGTARFNCGAKKILVDERQVSGVVTDDDDEITTKYVVSNVSPVTTYNQLIDPDLVPADAFIELKRRNLSTSAFTLFIGLDCDPNELKITETTNFLISTTDISDGIFDRMKRPDIQDDFLLLRSHSFIN
jgi:prolycopene isomerase